MERIQIIAEAGVNHNGSLEAALELIDAAADAAADVVKFQSFKSENVISVHAPKAEYQMRTTGTAESQLDMVRKLEFDRSAHEQLMRHCRKRGIAFLSTPFDEDSLEMLLDLGVDRLKIPSGEITNGPLLLKAGRSGLPVILSSGMSTLDDVRTALAVLAFGYLDDDTAPCAKAFESAFTSHKGRALLADKVILLHCTTEYPAPLEDVNLRAMDTLRETFGLRVGYSDHTPGIVVPVAAAARGAVLIEKHFTLDKNQEGPDHKASLEPAELTEMVRAIRGVERCLGSSEKGVAPSETGNKIIARKSLTAATAIRKGTTFTNANLTAKRPGGGRSPMDYWTLLGQTADRDYEPDEVID